MGYAVITAAMGMLLFVVLLAFAMLQIKNLPDYPTEIPQRMRKFKAILLLFALLSLITLIHAAVMYFQLADNINVWIMACASLVAVYVVTTVDLWSKYRRIKKLFPQI